MSGQNVRVMVRCRPLNSSEKEAKEAPIIEMPTEKAVKIYKSNADQTARTDEAPKTFIFDQVFKPNARQDDVFRLCAEPIVDDVLNGFNGTIFAYGQTGTGKTFSMEGVAGDPVLKGIMPRSFEHIFNSVAVAPSHIEYLVHCTYLEIYLDQVFDLFTPARKKLEIKEHPEKGVYVKDLSSYVVKSSNDLMKLLAKGQKARAVGATKMNAGSSRSHSVLTVTIEASETDTKENVHYRAGKLNLVDLAGSERQKRTGATGARLDEAKSINLALAALGNVIKALVTDKIKHIPYRDSKLTRILQDSLGGNTKTAMMAAIGPSILSFDETMSTLRYANRAKNIKNKAKINEDPKDAKLREMQDEIKALKAKLSGFGGVQIPGGVDGDEMEFSQDTIIDERVIEKVVYKNSAISEEEVERIKRQSLSEQKAIAAQMIKEKQEVLRAQKKTEIKAKKAASMLAKTEEQLEQERVQVEKIQKQITDREQQLMHGSTQLTYAQQQKRELDIATEQADAIRKQEAELKEQLEEVKEAHLYSNEQYGSRKAELKAKTSKLKQLWARYCEKKEEIVDIQNEWDVEREDLLDAVRTLDNQIRLKQLILDSFIPADYQQLVESQSHYDSYNDEWSISGMEYSINNIHNNEHAKDMPPPQGIGFCRRPPTPSQLGRYMSHLAAPHGGFDPHSVPPEMQEAMNAALLNDSPAGPVMPPDDIFFRYNTKKGHVQHLQMRSQGQYQ